MADPAPGRRPQLAVYLAQLLLVVAAGALWAASRLPWVVLVTQPFNGLGQPKTTTLTGAAWSTALVPLAVVALAAAVAAVAVRGWPLRALAVLVAAASLATGYLAISLWTVRDVAERGAALAHVEVVSLVGSERRSLGAALTLVAAVCTLLGAALLMRAAARAATTKYVAPGTRRSLAQSDDADAGLTERMLWDALDEGRDPTERPAQPPDTRDGQHGSESDTEGR
ncbi:TIGR02234 family membrane protein [Mycobacterium eburneum]|nr:TIGR02234 family membrane protein [Mycobacterium eburneum]TDH56912.1 TIGR02234 family membrane protein [Mycobacterium eburneum]